MFNLMNALIRQIGAEETRSLGASQHYIIDVVQVHLVLLTLRRCRASLKDISTREATVMSRYTGRKAPFDIVLGPFRPRHAPLDLAGRCPSLHMQAFSKKFQLQQIGSTEPLSSHHYQSALQTIISSLDK